MKHFILGIIATIVVAGAGSVVYAKYVQVEEPPTYVDFVSNIKKMYDPYLNVACYTVQTDGFGAKNISCVALGK